MTTTLIKDPITGAFTGNADPSGGGRSMVELNGGVVSPGGATASGQGTDPYALFNRNVASILSQIQGAQAQGNAKLGGAKDYLSNLAIAPNGPTPFDPHAFSGGQIAGQNALQESFAPGITSINTQLENTDKSLNSLSDNLGRMATIFQPRDVPVGSSLETPGGEVITPGFNPAINPESGMPYGYVDFSGKSTGVGAYATDPNYQEEVDGTLGRIQEAIPTPSADTLDTYIAGHVKSAPISGQMIMSAAAQYKVDPNQLLAVIQHESDVGTSGQAPKNNNPGGIKFAGQPGATVGTLAPENDGSHYANFRSWQQGVNATASEIAKRTVKESNQSTPTGGQFSSEAAQRVQQLPTLLRPYVQAGPKGVAYIDSSKVPDQVMTTMQTLGGRLGIPVLDEQAVHNIQAIGVVYENVVRMKTLVAETLNTGLKGGIKDMAKTTLNDITHQNAFPELARFNSYRDVAIKAVQALAGGSGSGLRLNTGEIMASTQTLPDSADRVETANEKITGLVSLLDTTLAQNFPYTQGQQPGASGADGGTVKVKDPKTGKTGTIPVNQLEDALKEGYQKI